MVHWYLNSARAKVGQPISYGEFTRRTGLYLLPISNEKISNLGFYMD